LVVAGGSSKPRVYDGHCILFIQAFLRVFELERDELFGPGLDLEGLFGECVLVPEPLPEI